jgi:hypothetical protein
VAPVLGPQRENFGVPEQITGRQQKPGGPKTGPRSASVAGGWAMPWELQGTESTLEDGRERAAFLARPSSALLEAASGD